MPWRTLRYATESNNGLEKEPYRKKPDRTEHDLTTPNATVLIFEKRKPCRTKPCAAKRYGK